MAQFVAKPSTSLTPDEKSAVLAQVLSSRTFHKCDLLIRFLRYVGEQEISGHPDEISEYSIATEALGRPADFSPEADSCVRSRAHALRRKLEDCYREELRDARSRVVLQKGSYVPEFVLAPSAPEPSPPVSEPPQSVAPRRAYLPLLLAFATGAAAMLLACIILYRASGVQAKPSPPPSLGQAWGPLLTSNSDVLVVVAIPKQFWAREFGVAERPRNERWYPNLPQDSELRRWFYETATPNPNTSILLHPNVGSPLWGDMAGAIGAVRTLAIYGVKHQVLPERVLKPYALRGRNVLLFGNSEYSPAVRQLLKDAPFRVEYDPVSHWEAIVNEKPLPGEPDAFRRSRNEDCLGLITIIGQEPGETRPSQIAIFSGLTSAGTQAAQEFFASPSALADLGARFKAGKAASWPQSYQVVIQASTDLNLPITSRYLAHRILTP